LTVVLVTATVGSVSGHGWLGFPVQVVIPAACCCSAASAFSWPSGLAARGMTAIRERARRHRPSAVRLGILTTPTRPAGGVQLPARHARLTAATVQHLGVLETAGLIAIEKGYAGKRARTWVTLTKAGQAALEDEIASSNC